MSTVTFRVGIVESSRLTDIERVFRDHYPKTRLTYVKSHLQLNGVDAVLAGRGPDLNPELYGQDDRACRQRRVRDCTWLLMFESRC